MIVEVQYQGKRLDRIQCRDVGMGSGCIILKMSDETDTIIPFNNVCCIHIDKETPVVVRPNFGGKS